MYACILENDYLISLVLFPCCKKKSIILKSIEHKNKIDGENENLFEEEKVNYFEILPRRNPFYRSQC